MKKFFINARWEQSCVSAESAPMCSYSERDEFVDTSKWVYELPEGYGFVKTLPDNVHHEHYEIIGNGEIIGYAVKPYAYITFGEIFYSWKDLVGFEYFHPSEYQIAYSKEQATKFQDQQNRLIAEGGWGD
jgi:hypothetical protein